MEELVSNILNEPRKEEFLRKIKSAMTEHFQIPNCSDQDALYFVLNVVSYTELITLDQVKVNLAFIFQKCKLNVEFEHVFERGWQASSRAVCWKAKTPDSKKVLRALHFLFDNLKVSIILCFKSN